MIIISFISLNLRSFFQHQILFTNIPQNLAYYYKDFNINTYKLRSLIKFDVRRTPSLEKRFVTNNLETLLKGYFVVFCGDKLIHFSRFL